MKISVVIEGLFSFLLSHLLKLGGSFEISCCHLASPVPGSTVAPEGRGKPGFICVVWIFQPGPGRPESLFLPSLKSPFAPFCKVSLPSPSRLALLPFECKYLLIYKLGKEQQKANEGQLKSSFLNPPRQFTVWIKELRDQLQLTLPQAALALPRESRLWEKLLEVERC